MKKNLLMAFALFVTLSAFAAKPPLDHSVYDGWKSVSRLVVENNGEWAQWTVAPQEGDVVLHLYNVKTGKTYDIERASQAKISADASKVVFRIAPKYQETRQARIDKKKPNEMPKDTLGILDLSTGKIEKYPLMKNFKTGETLGEYVAFQEADKPAAKPDPKEKKEQEKAPEAKPTKDNLYVLNIKTLAVDTLACVESYIFSKKGDRIAYITKPEKKDSLNVRGVFLYDPAAKAVNEVLKGEKEATFKGLVFNEDADRLAFFATLDTAKDAKKNLDLWMYDGTARKLIDHTSSVLPKGWKIGDNRNVEFHKNFLLLGTCPIPREKDTTLVEFEQPKLDIWVWNDDYIQTVQKNNLRRDLCGIGQL